MNYVYYDYLCMHDRCSRTRGRIVDARGRPGGGQGRPGGGAGVYYAYTYRFKYIHRYM